MIDIEDLFIFYSYSDYKFKLKNLDSLNPYRIIEILPLLLYVFTEIEVLSKLLHDT